MCSILQINSEVEFTDQVNSPSPNVSDSSVPVSMLLLFRNTKRLRLFVEVFPTVLSFYEFGYIGPLIVFLACQHSSSCCCPLNKGRNDDFVET